MTITRILVGVALDEHDRDTLRFVARLAAAHPVEQVVFLNVIRPPELDHAVYRVFPDLRAAIFDAGRNQLRLLVENEASLPDTVKWETKVVEGSPLVEILDRSRRMNADLIVIGRKRERGWMENLPTRLARKAPCSVLIVPEGSDSRLSRILVPIDFSDRSRLALETAFRLARDAGGAHVQPLHVLSDSVQSLFARQFPEDYDEHLRALADAEWEDFRKSVEEPHLEAGDMLFVKHASPQLGIREAAGSEAADLIVLGSRGRSNVAALLLGGVADGVASHSETPVLLVREQGDNEPFLRSLLGGTSG